MVERVKALQNKISEKMVELQDDVESMYQRGEYDQNAMFDLDESVRLLNDLTLELFSIAG